MVNVIASRRVARTINDNDQDERSAQRRKIIERSNRNQFTIFDLRYRAETHYRTTIMAIIIQMKQSEARLIIVVQRYTTICIRWYTTYTHEDLVSARVIVISTRYERFSSLINYGRQKGKDSSLKAVVVPSEIHTSRSLEYREEGVGGDKVKIG